MFAARADTFPDVAAPPGARPDNNGEAREDQSLSGACGGVYGGIAATGAQATKM